MIFIDFVTIAALATFTVAWWIRSAKFRQTILTASASILILCSIVGYLDYRWQIVVSGVIGLLFLVVLLIGKLRRSNEQDSKRGVQFITGALIGLIALVGISAVYLFPVPDLPKPSGEHAVGVRSFEITDTSRLGVFAASPTEPRRLLVRAWYPAENTNGLTPRPYFTDDEAKTTGVSMGSFVGFGPFFTYMKHAETNSFENAPLLKTANNQPTVFFSHGYTSYLSQNTVLMEELASHGYIIYSVQHTYDSAATLFANGDIVPTDKNLFEDTKKQLSKDGQVPDSMIKAYTGETYGDRLGGSLDMRAKALAQNERIGAHSTGVWLADRLFLHDQLQAGLVSAQMNEIVNASNFDHTGQMGMSFGGSTSGAVCMLDTRCAAGVNLDGGDFHFDAFNADMPVPFLMFYSDMRYMAAALGAPDPSTDYGHNDFSYEKLEKAGKRKDIYRAFLKGAQHLGISDFSMFLRGPIKSLLAGDAASNTIIQSQNDFVRGFLDKHLRGVENNFPAYQYEKYSGEVTKQDNAGVREWWQQLEQQERENLENRIQSLKAER